MRYPNNGHFHILVVQIYSNQKLNDKVKEIWDLLEVVFPNLETVAITRHVDLETILPYY